MCIRDRDRLDRPVPEGHPPARGERQGRRPGPPVGGLRHAGAIEDLRRQESRGAHHQSGRGDPRIIGPVRDAEVDQHRPSVMQQHVGGFEVAVDDAHRVDGRQCLGEVLGQGPQGLGWQGSVPVSYTHLDVYKRQQLDWVN